MSKKKTKTIDSMELVSPADVAAGAGVTATLAPAPAEAAGAAASPPVPQEPGPEAAKTRSPRRKAAAASGPSLADAARGYLAHLEERGASAGTMLGYEFELMNAVRDLGEDQPLASVTAANVLWYFESPRVTLTRGGKPKSPLSIAKSRRVLRQALVWAVAAGLIEKAPLPEVASGT